MTHMPSELDSARFDPTTEPEVELQSGESVAITECQPPNTGASGNSLCSHQTVGSGVCHIAAQSQATLAVGKTRENHL